MWICLIITIGVVLMVVVCCVADYYINHKCQHTYKVIDKNDLYWCEDVVGTQYTLQCTKCGKIKSKKIGG